MVLLLPAHFLLAACACDPDVSFSQRPEVTLPVGASANVDINLGNSASNFVTAAYEQINGSVPSAAVVNAQVTNLTTLPYWRRIDTVNSFLNTANSNKTKIYSNPWAGDSLFNTAPCKNVTRDVGAVCMYFFGCVGGVNCQMNWANTHAHGMDIPSPVLGYGGNATGIYNSSVNTGFWYRELLDARYAGLQFLMPNVYGPDLANGSIANLSAALANIAGQGLTSQVKIALFDDTSGWNSGNGAPWNSIPTFTNPAAAAAAIFNNKWKPFFQGIPAAYWYTVGGKPLIYFYNAGTLTPLNQSAATISQLKSLFQAQFGVLPYVVVDKAFFADAAMPSTADNEFVWDTLHAAPALPNSLSSYTFGGVKLDHAMVKWDPLGRNYYNNTAPNYHIAGAGDGLIKDATYLQNALVNSGPTGDNANILVLASWNDLGEGTGINRNYDYYINGAWQPPDYFMNYIRAAQSQQTCGVILPTIAPTPVQNPMVTDFETANAAAKMTEWNAGSILTAKDAYTTTLLQTPWNYAAHTVAGNGSAKAGRISGVLAPQIVPTQYPYAYMALELNPGGSVPANANTNVLPVSPNKGLSFDFKAGAAGVQYRVDLVERDGATIFAYTYFQFVFTASDTAWHTVTVYFPGVAGGGFRFARPGGGTFDPSVLGAVMFQVQPVNGATVTYDLTIDNVTFAVPPAPPAIGGPLITDFDTNNASIGTVTEWNNGNILSAKDAIGSTLTQSPWKWNSGTAPGTTGVGGRISGTLAAQDIPTSKYPYSYLALELKPGGSVPTNANIDVTPYAPNKGLQFDYKAAAAGVQYRVDLVEKDGATTFAYTYFQYVFTSTDTAWHTVDVYFPSVIGGANHFSRPGGGTFDPTTLGAVLFQVQPQNGSPVVYDLTVDNVSFNSPTPPTPTPTPTASPSPSATRSPTPSATSTATYTVNPTSTPTPTPTRSNTPASTSTFTSTLSSSPSPASSSTSTPTITVTRTNTALSSSTFTSTLTSTPSSTATLTRTSTITPTFSVSPTISPSPAGSLTNSPTATPSGTNSPVQSFTSTTTRTNTPSSTSTATLTRTGTITLTSTTTLSSTSTPSVTATPAGSLTNSPTLTSSRTITPLLTSTSSSTPTTAVTSTFTSTSSFTRSPTSSSTLTSTRTLSSTPTFTATPSSSSSATPSLTSTRTPSSTVSATITLSHTFSPTPPGTYTETPTYTSSPTVSATFSVSPSNTPSVTPSLTSTASFTSSLTASPSITVTVTSSSTSTQTVSVTSSQTSTRSATPTQSLTVISSGTTTPTPAGSFTSSPTRTSTPTSSRTATLTQTSFSTATGTSTITVTITPSSTVTETAVSSPTATPSSTPTTLISVASSTPGHGSGGHVDRCLPSLNPQTGPVYSFSVYLSDYSESLKLRIYGKAMTAIAEIEIPGYWQPGWNKVSITPPDLSNGLYYVLVRSGDDARYLHKPALLMVIR